MAAKAAAPRWERRKEARPEEIIDAALSVFSRKGYAAAKMDEIAALAGITKGTLYLYYPSKDELFRTVIRHQTVPEIAQFEEQLAACAGPTAPILAAFMTQAARMSKGRNSLIPKVIVAECANFPELARFWADEVAARGQALIRSILDRGAALGEWPEADADTAFVLFAPLLQLSIWNGSIGAVTGRPLDPETYIAEAVRIILGGLPAPRKET